LPPKLAFIWSLRPAARDAYISDAARQHAAPLSLDAPERFCRRAREVSSTRQCGPHLCRAPQSHPSSIGAVFAIGRTASTSMPGVGMPQPVRRHRGVDAGARRGAREPHATENHPDLRKVAYQLLPFGEAEETRTNKEEHAMRNWSIGALVAMILGLAAGAGSTASAAPIGNLATVPALSENNIVVPAARRGGHRGGTVYRGRTVHRGVAVHRRPTVRRGGVVYRGGVAYGTSPYCGYYPYPPCYYSGGGAVYRGGTVYRGRTVHRGATVHRGSRAHVSHHRGGGRRR
jgi:hypothetical protein